MPNWCFNDCEITGEDRELTRFLDLIGEDFDFERIIPSPVGEELSNWGTNKLAMLVDVTRYDGSISLRFDTAWSFPAPIFKQLAALFPTLEFEGHAEERMIGLFYDFEAHDGELTVSRWVRP